VPVRPRVSAKVFAAIALLAIGLVAAPAATAASSAGHQAVAFRLPYLAGQSYPVTQGWHDSYSHHGKSAYAYDFGLPMGTPVVAAAAGVVAYAASGHKGCGDESLRSAANFVTIYHPDGTATLYAHLSRVTAHVGDVVQSGQVIGYSGKTGYTNCEPHLHFARQRQGRAVTQSIPIYFVEAHHRRLGQGADVTSHNPVCSQTTTDLPNGSFCGVYTKGSDLGDLPFVRLDHGVRIGSVTKTGTRVPLRGATAPTGASWIGRYRFAASGNYLFDVEADGIVQLWIDGELVLDTSVDPAATTDAAAAGAPIGLPGTSAAIGAVPAPQPSANPAAGLGLALSVTDGPAVGEHVLTAWLPSGQHVIRLVYDAGATSFLRFDWRQVDPDAVVRTLY